MSEEIVPASTVAAGWYDDPTSPGVVRWWDGYAWTEHRAPKSQPAAQQIVVGGYRKTYKTSHAFHLIMSICTLGLWLPIWVIVAIYNAAKS